MAKKILVGYCIINENMKNTTAGDAEKLTHRNVAAGAARSGEAAFVRPDERRAFRGGLRS